MSVGAFAVRCGRVRTLTVDDLDVRRLHDTGRPPRSLQREQFTALVLLLVSLLASFVPARHAATASPLDALRAE